MDSFESDNPLDDLRRLITRYQAIHLDELPPFAGGAIGYAGYDVVRYAENLPDAPEDDRRLPDMTFAFYDRVVVFDNVSKTLFVIAMTRPDQHPSTVDAYNDACQRIDAFVEQLMKPSSAAVAADINHTGADAETCLLYTSPSPRD